MESSKYNDDTMSCHEFRYALENNPGIIILKLSATWCKPCQVILPQVKAWFDKLTNISDKLRFMTWM